MPAIDWNSLASATDWENALTTLQQAAATARAGTRADRQDVEGELASFWLIPCPFAKKIDRARDTYNSLVLLDLGQLIDATTTAAPSTALPAPRALAPHEQQLAQALLQNLTTLHEQHRQHLAAHLAMAQQISSLQAAVRQLLPQKPAGRRKSTKK